MKKEKNYQTIIRKTALYIRVSTEDQALEGYSVNAQIDKLSKYAEANDWEIYDIYIDDGKSGKNISGRPEMKRLIKDVEDGYIDNILTYKLDRLTRSLRDLMGLIEFFEKFDCSLNSQTERLDTSNAVGRMFLKILGTFAEFERENLAERVAFGFEQKVREGNYINGRGVYGYDYIPATKTETGKLVVNQSEAIIVRQIFNWYIEGDSMHKISQRLKSMKVSTKRGGVWQQATIRSILINPLYVGIIRYGTKNNKQDRYFETEGKNIDAIITKEKFEETQHCMSKRQNFKIRRYPSEKAYYFRALRCAKCNGLMYSHQFEKNGKSYVNYYCNNARIRNCSAAGFSQPKMNKAFEEYLEKIDELVPSNKLLEKANKKNDEDEIRESLEKKLRAIKRKKDEARNMFINDGLPSEEYKKLTKALDERELYIKNEMSNLGKKEKDPLSSYDVKNIVGKIKLNWKCLTDKEKQRFMEQFIDAISVVKENNEVIIKDIQFEAQVTRKIVQKVA